MNAERVAWWVASVWCLGLASGAGGCDDGGGDADADADADADVDQDADADVEAEVPPPPERCRPGTAWEPGDQVYEERTADVGLEDVQMQAAAVADVDEDGWPDVLIIGSDSAGYPVARLFMNREGDGVNGRALVDETEGSGVLATRAGDPERGINMATFGDANNDGHVDLFTATWRDQNLTEFDEGDRAEVLLNDGAAHFELAAELPDMGEEEPLPSATMFLDQDLDGNLDLFIARWWIQPPFSSPFGQHPVLLRGDGEGGFDDVTTDVGIELLYTRDSILDGTSARPLFGAVACDVSGDGTPDIVGTAYARYWNLLWVSDGDRYVELGRESGVAGDDNVDYTDDKSYLCYCHDHPGDCPADVEPPSPFFPCPGRGWMPGWSDSPCMLNGNTFSVACGDVDNDGDMDLYTSDIAHDDVGQSSDRAELLINESTADEVRFERPGRDATGLAPPDEGQADEGGQNNGLWDFDNDGRLDAYLGGSPYSANRGWLFHQGDGLVFEWIGARTGFHPDCPHGVALADLDRDGDQDLITGTYGCIPADGGAVTEPQVAHVYENVASDNNWTSIRLVGGGAGAANASAIGAVVRVTAGGVTQTQEIQASWGRGGLSREPVAHFGLGAECEIERVEVVWPDRAHTTQTFTGVVANYRVELRQGDGRVRYLP
jgi:hypothetical protein